MPYPDAVENWNGISYAAEPLRLRDKFGDPAGVFRSDAWGDPRNVVTVPAGTPLTYRVAQPWGNQAHVPTLEGHRWLLEPNMAGSEQVYNHILVPGMSLNLHFVGGAGGDIHAPGDYLFLDRRQPFMEGGLWNILRVTGDGTSGSDDDVNVFFTAIADDGANGTLESFGFTTMRPAGDFADEVSFYTGPEFGGSCTGSVIGSAAVDPGSGVWLFEQPLAAPLPSLCVQSDGGGATTVAVFFTGLLWG